MWRRAGLVCVNCWSTSTVNATAGGSADASQPRRIIVFPTVLNAKQQVIPDAPTDATWAMANAFHESEAGLDVELDPDGAHCREYAILTYRPYFEGYPPGTYVATDELTIDGAASTVEVTVTVPEPQDRAVEA